MNKHQVAKVLEDIGRYLELTGANPFKIRAYHHAARAIENLEEDLEKIIKEKRLLEVPGIGESIAAKIKTLVEKGKLPYFEKLKKSIPEGLLEMREIAGLGGKKIKILYEKLKITTVDELVAACKEGKLASLRGFGEKTQQNILHNIEKLEQFGKKYLWIKAADVAQPILEDLLKLKEVKRAEIAGSLRRGMEIVGDLDFLVSSSKPESVMKWFTTHPRVAEILSKGKSKSSVRLLSGMQADLRVVPDAQFPFSLLYFTGSKGHNIKLRNLALTFGYSLNEYGFEKMLPDKTFEKLGLVLKSEDEIYQTLFMDYIPPELREDTGEIEAAISKKLPKLIEIGDIKGVFHCHTTSSDGHDTLEEMVQGAQDLGWQYIGIADHSKASYQAGGMDENQLFEEIDKIRKLNASKKFTPWVFAGLECDILKDGEMDFPNEVLKELDFVVASVHRSFKLSEEEMTKRLIKAIENPYTTIIGHLTGRLLLHREPYAVDINKVVDACVANGKIIELNSHPMRLDMDWRHWRGALEKGLKCSINPDAHSIKELQYYMIGVQMARKGWMRKEDVLNAQPLDEVRKLLIRSR